MPSNSSGGDPTSEGHRPFVAAAIVALGSAILAGLLSGLLVWVLSRGDVDEAGRRALRHVEAIEEQVDLIREQIQLARDNRRLQADSEFAAGVAELEVTMAGMDTQLDLQVEALRMAGAGQIEAAGALYATAERESGRLANRLSATSVLPPI